MSLNVDEMVELFIYAVDSGDLETVKKLLPTYKNIYTFKKPLDLACKRGHLEIVKYLVSKGAKFTLDDDWGLLKAIEDGKLNVVKYILEESGVEYYNKKNVSVMLRKSNVYGHDDIFEYIIMNCPVFDFLESHISRTKLRETLDVICKKRILQEDIKKNDKSDEKRKIKI